MKNRICPKCGGNNIYTNLGIINYYGDRSSVEVSAFFGLRTVIYICTDCRYLEEYITDNQELDKLKKKWRRV